MAANSNGAGDLYDTTRDASNNANKTLNDAKNQQTKKRSSTENRKSNMQDGNYFLRTKSPAGVSKAYSEVPQKKRRTSDIKNTFNANNSSGSPVTSTLAPSVGSSSSNSRASTSNDTNVANETPVTDCTNFMDVVKQVIATNNFFESYSHENWHPWWGVSFLNCELETAGKTITSDEFVRLKSIIEARYKSQTDFLRREFRIMIKAQAKSHADFQRQARISHETLIKKMKELQEALLKTIKKTIKEKIKEMEKNVLNAGYVLKNKK